jgi:hypothetical protein
MKKGLVFYYVFLGVFVGFVFVLSILQLFPQFSLDPGIRYKYRYESFVKLLNQEEKNLFLSGDYEKCAKLLDERIMKDENLRKNIQTIKEYEVIDTFRTGEMLEYFGYYMYNELKKYNPNYELK